MKNLITSGEIQYPGILRIGVKIMLPLLFLGFLSLLFISCSEQDAGDVPELENIPQQPGIVSTTSISSSSGRVMMQGFYWDCFNESGNGNWWDHIRPKMSELAAAGVTEVWLPPAQKSHHNPSMGYDPYDWYDLGEFDQKNTVETYFGSRTELENLISAIHNNGMLVYADLVYNHMRGGDFEYNPNTNSETETSFTPLSGKFEFHYDNFHPSSYEESDPDQFSDFPDLAHANPATYSTLENYSKWMKSTIGYDGWRYDWVNGMWPWVIKDLQTNVGGFGVVEYWSDTKQQALSYLNDINYTASAFDFHLFYALRDMANDNNKGSYDLSKLWGAGIIHDLPENTVTMVQNHDLDKESAYQISNTDKMMAYAVILTHQGIPQVFWKDYYNYGLAKSGNPDGIDQLLWVRHNLADGSSSLLHASSDMYIMQRNGTPGLVMALNDNPRNTNSATVSTKWANTVLKPYAWGSSKDSSTPSCVTTDGNGNVTISVVPRGYVVYAPDDGTISPVSCNGSGDGGGSDCADKGQTCSSNGDCCSGNCKQNQCR